jgi:hypothetical protein
MWTPHHPKPDIVVTVVRMVVVAESRTRVVLIVVPRAPAQHPRLIHGPPHRFPGEDQDSRDEGGLEKKFPPAARGAAGFRTLFQRQ